MLLRKELDIGPGRKFLKDAKDRPRKKQIAARARQGTSCKKQKRKRIKERQIVFAVRRVPDQMPAWPADAAPERG